MQTSIGIEPFTKREQERNRLFPNRASVLIKLKRNRERLDKYKMQDSF